MLKTMLGIQGRRQQQPLPDLSSPLSTSRTQHNGSATGNGRTSTWRSPQASRVDNAERFAVGLGVALAVTPRTRGIDLHTMYSSPLQIYESREVRTSVQARLSSPETMTLYYPQSPSNVDDSIKVVESSEDLTQDAPSYADTFLNLTCAILGAGILAMPYAFQINGWTTGVVLAICSAVAAYTSVLIARCLGRSMDILLKQGLFDEPCDWPLIGYAAFGTAGQALVNLVFLGELYFVLLSYLVLNGCNLSALLPFSWATKDALIIATGFLSFALLFCPFWILSYFSFAGIAALAISVVLVLATGIEMPVRPDPSSYAVFQNGSISQVVGIVLFCFVCHSTIPSLYVPMKDKHEFAEVVVTSFSTSLIVYLFTGAVGYFYFAGAIQQDVIQNIGRDRELNLLPGLAFMPLLASAGFVLKLQLSFPLFAAPLISACEAHMGMSERTPSWQKFIWRATFMAGTTLIAVLMKDSMADILALTGCLFSMSTAMIFPAVFYFKLFISELSCTQSSFLILLTLVGLYFMVTGTLTSIQNILGAMDTNGRAS